MLSIKRVLREEQTRICAVLDKEIAELPVQVQPVARHTLNAGGKRLRPLLAIYMGRLFGCNHPDIYAMAAAIEFFHVATLIHDDILDNATTRRGVPAAHTIYTPTIALLGGDAMLAHAAKIVATIGNTYISQQFAEAVLQTAAGEIAEFTHQGNAYVSHSEYLSMITGKTAWSLKVACQLPAYYAGASPDDVEAAATFGLELGIAFQIVDDALDIAPSKETGKPSGGDLREGKCTLLTRLFIETLSEADKEVFSEKFTHHAFTDAEISSIIKDMRDKGLDKKTRDLAQVHLDTASAALSRLPDTHERKVLFQVPDFIKNRAS